MGRWIFATVAVLLLAFTFQGSRGIAEPDEGYFSNAALEMIRSGDWLLPRVNGQPFLDKPPLHYWGMAAGMSLLGVNAWGARAAQALWFAGTALLVGLLAGRLGERIPGPWAAVAYAACLGPFVAGNVLTPDTVLTFWTGFALYAYWRAFSASSPAGRLLWWCLLGAGFGLGFLAKGPAMAIFTAPVAAHLLLTRRLRSSLAGPGPWLAALIAVGVGGWWYAWLFLREPGAWRYVLDNQVVGRLWTASYNRNPGWTGPLKIYLPTLLVGSLPWCLLLFRRRFWRRLLVAGKWRALPDRPGSLLLILWLGLPLLVFSLASSRLPFYILPVFAPLTLLLLRQLPHRRTVPMRPTLLATWVLLLVALRLGAALPVFPWDSRALARSIAETTSRPTRPLVAVDLHANGLALYGFPELEWVTTSERPYRFYRRQEHLADRLDRLRAEPRPQRFLVESGKLPLLEELLARRSLRYEVCSLPLDRYLVDCPPALEDKQKRAHQSAPVRVARSRFD